jgi:hypothetical protein
MGRKSLFEDNRLMNKENVKGFLGKTLAAMVVAATLTFLPVSSLVIYAADDTEAFATTEYEKEQEVLGAKRLLTAEETMNTYPGLIIILVASVGTAISAITPRIIIKKYR